MLYIIYNSYYDKICFLYDKINKSGKPSSLDLVGKTSLSYQSHFQGPPLNAFSPTLEEAIFVPEQFLYQKLNRRKESLKNLDFCKSLYNKFHRDS